MKEWIKIKFQKGAPDVLEFLEFILQQNKREFTGIELKTYKNSMFLSGDRYLRYLRESGLIQYDVEQRNSKYRLKSDIFDIEKAKSIISSGGFWQEIQTQLSIF